MRVHRLLRSVVLTLGLVPGGALAQSQPLPPGAFPPPPLADYPQPPLPPPLPPPPLMPPPEPPSGLTVYMRTNDLGATLSRLSGETTRRFHGRHGLRLRTVDLWSAVCRAPCGQVVNPDDVYLIRGLNINDSDRFMLPTSGVVSLDIRAGHPGTRVGGVLLTTFGSMVTAVGLVFTPLGAALLGSHSSSGSASKDNPGAGFLIAGGITLGAGVAMLAGGIRMLVVSRTTVRISDGYRIGATTRPPRLAFSSAGLHF